MVPEFIKQYGELNVGFSEWCPLDDVVSNEGFNSNSASLTIKSMHSGEGLGIRVKVNGGDPSLFVVTHSKTSPSCLPDTVPTPENSPGTAPQGAISSTVDMCPKLGQIED